MQAKKSDMLKTPIRYLKGVGPKKSEELSRLGIETVEQALCYFPFRHEDRSNVSKIKDLSAGESRSVQGEVIAVGGRIARNGMPVFQAAVSDGTGVIHAVWFNQPYLKDYIRKAQSVILYGRIERHERLQITQPEYEILKEDDKDSVHIGRIVPVYRLTARLSQRYMRGLAFEVVSKYHNCVSEKLPTYLLAREHLVDVKFAIMNIHFPSSFENLDRAYRRVVFEEFFILQLALALKKRGSAAPSQGLGHVVKQEIAESFMKALPYSLTEGQKKAMADIERDMASGRAMNRLLEGDVGSGKTVVAAYALALTVSNGYQGVIMAPTEVLARQHFIVLSELLMPLGINVALLIGGIDKKSREELYSRIKKGEVDILVGTHAIIQEGVEFNRVGLAVIDEQHKFGVSQRALLKKKGYGPHILVMTATPIPRTLALTVYGDLDMSVIKELPKGRKPIVTYWVEESKRDEVYRFIRDELGMGRQAYVVCPWIDGRAEGPGSGAPGAVGRYEELRDGPFSGFRVALLHGRMASKEKDKVMREFRKGAIDLLVSTVVIEVGIDNPNATVMLVENADRFGLAQLHQLRGRIGRGEHESYCILLADPKNSEAVGRLRTIEGTPDGFEIAEADLELRGPGEFLGTRQHGLPEIRFGDILKDFDIMELARRDAFALVAKDPGLSEERHRRLMEALAVRFKDRIGIERCE